MTEGWKRAREREGMDKEKERGSRGTGREKRVSCLMIRKTLCHDVGDRVPAIKVTDVKQIIYHLKSDHKLASNQGTEKRFIVSDITSNWSFSI